ncbi:MAG: imidazole glycerol phosphate synthase subunit HisF [Candidatus Altiarchaeota archaeon]|nr:imidazole glycerol phosphate synthase subunit HisF [Candidatus Altiarchaeota archaeon]
MIKRRFILCLLLDNGVFMNSRNFELNPVGNIETIEQYLNFEAIDELIIVNVERGEKDLDRFCAGVKEVAKRCFVPITAGGGVKSIEDFQKLLNSGADKVIINTAAYEDPKLITEASKVFGSQCVVVSIDVKKDKGGAYEVYIHNGSKDTHTDVFDWVKKVEKLGAGEIFLTSIDQDGSCQGYDLDLVKKVSHTAGIPIIASGGVGEFKHLVEGIRDGDASAVSAANIFHFIGHSLIKAKTYLNTSGLNFPHTLWHFNKEFKDDVG